MADEHSEQQEQTEGQERSEQGGDQNGTNGGGGGGLKTAAAASVAAGVSYLVAKRALDHRSGTSGESGDESSSGEGAQKSSGDSSSGGGKSTTSRTSESLRSAVDVLTWDKAQSMLLPMAERAATAAGGYVAKEAPEIVSERLIPRFIEAFTKARSS